MAYTKFPSRFWRRVIEAVEDLIVGKRVVKTATPAIPVSASNATTMDLSQGDVWTYTPTENTTITPTNPAPGQRVSIIVQATASSRTLTFASPFLPSATLVTGTDATKKFLVEFQTDSAGVYLLESFRSLALPA